MFVFSKGRRRLMAFAAATSLVTALAGCGDKKPEFLGSDITGSHLGKDMAMQDSGGKLRTLADYKGKVKVVFFGFTQCPDVCPTAMAELGETMKLLGDDASKTQVILISVDPERDTPDVLHGYVTAFDPSFIGLTGTPEQLADTAKSFKAYYAKVKTAGPGQYTMDHAASFYILDQDGEARVLVSGNAPAKDIAHDIQALL